MNILVTGGAGFIGSHIVEALVEHPEVKKVRIIDNFATGDFKNIEAFSNSPKFEFIEGDIRDFDTCMKACEGIDKITHQAALGSVPRSMKDPQSTHNTNVNGTLNIFNAALKNKVDRVVFASSSSVYGDHPGLPKIEDKIGNAISPYALTKLINEQYAAVYAKAYDFKYVGLRYFNIFGPKQRLAGPYAAVIPIFIEHAVKNISPVINGDGNFSRDFTYVKNAVEANLKSMFTSNPSALNEVYNIAIGDRINLNNLWGAIKENINCEANATHGPERAGDVPHSLANISKAKTLLNYDPAFGLEDGLAATIKWYKKNLEEVYSS